jgi:hypothetical protein
MTTFNIQETALFLANGDFWAALPESVSKSDLSNQLDALYEIADGISDPTKLQGTLPDNTIIAIGGSPRRPKPNA